MKIKSIIEKLEKQIPLSYQETWDHSGLQVGSLENECEKVLICLNVDDSTIQQAIAHGTNLIISHHPFMFHSIKEIDTTTIRGKNIQLLLQYNITVYSMHTNYDALRMNTVLLEKIGCECVDEIENNPILRKGIMTNCLSFTHFITHIKQTFHLSHVRVCGHIPNYVKEFVLCAGSGHDDIELALSIAPIYLTGDLTYTHAMDIIEMKNGCVIEVPHFIEEAFKKDVQKLIDFPSILADEHDYFIEY